MRMRLSYNNFLIGAAFSRLHTTMSIPRLLVSSFIFQSITQNPLHVRIRSRFSQDNKRLEFDKTIQQTQKYQKLTTQNREFKLKFA